MRALKTHGPPPCTSERAARLMVKVTQTFRAGRLTGVPPFALGLGLSVRPSLTAGAGVRGPGAPIRGDRAASLDATQLLGENGRGGGS